MDKKAILHQKPCVEYLYKRRQYMHIYSTFMHNERQNNVILCIFLSFYLVICKIYCNFAAVKRIKIQHMKAKNSRLETLKMLISSQELSSQDQLLEALHKEGFKITQATLSRDLKLLKVAKAASSSGKYAYVLPNDTLYKRVSNHIPVSKMMVNTGFQSINFSGNMVVIKTRPGYASSIAYNIDNSDISQILGTIAGDDTIFLVKKKGTTEEEIINALAEVLRDVHHKYI